MNWITLDTDAGLAQLIEKSATQPQVIFKHSTRCSISTMAKNRLERSTEPDMPIFHYLDLITYRNLSNAIAEQFDIPHQSPQILVIKNGSCVYSESHSAIDMDEIVDAL